MKIGIQGLGKMGMQIAKKLVDDNHQLVALNRSAEPLSEIRDYGAKTVSTKEELVKEFKDERVIIWLMLPAEIIHSEVEQWLSILPKNSLIIDGGNSDYRNTRSLADKIEQAGSTMIDVGTSGGVHGYKNGFSMMAGSNNKADFLIIEPVLKSLSFPEGAYQYFGSAGAGHFVKMTHNAIEYGMMESLAEGYNFLKNGPYDNINLADAGEVWQHHSVITSWLNELCRDILTTNPELDGINGYVKESGEARWTIETADGISLPMPAIKSAFQVRLDSQNGTTNFSTKLLAAMRNSFGGHDLNK